MIEALQQLSAYAPAMFAIASLLTSIAALLAGISSYRASSNQRRLVEATFFQDFNNRYKSKAMETAIRALVLFYFDNPTSFVDRWHQGRAAGSRESLEIDSHRRVVSTYFGDIARLVESRHISHDFARMVTDVPGLNVFYEIVSPMNRTLRRPTSVEKILSTLKKLHVRFESGLYDPREIDRSAKDIDHSAINAGSNRRALE